MAAATTTHFIPGIRSTQSIIIIMLLPVCCLPKSAYNKFQFSRLKALSVSAAEPEMFSACLLLLLLLLQERYKQFGMFEGRKR